ncbi:LSU ribosomal protein L25p [gamma proteobacterium IMCC1989]|nr:LSU ribosomal protein L25p [gamma proteobacterium IMCC1989]
MSNEDFVLHAESRELTGKGASRRLRRESSMVPGIIYGGSKKPQMISLLQKDLIKHLENEAFYSHIISVEVDGAAQDVILKDLQRHPAKPLIYHLDLLRVSKTKKFTTRVPLHFINEETSKGVKVQGGMISHSVTELEISCLPADLPEYIEVDLADVEIGQTVHISDLTLPKGVESVQLSHGHDHDLPVASINKPKGAAVDEDSSEETEEAGEE